MATNPGSHNHAVQVASNNPYGQQYPGSVTGPYVASGFSGRSYDEILDEFERKFLTLTDKVIALEEHRDILEEELIEWREMIPDLEKRLTALEYSVKIASSNTSLNNMNLNHTSATMDSIRLDMEDLKKELLKAKTKDSRKWR